MCNMQYKYTHNMPSLCISSLKTPKPYCITILIIYIASVYNVYMPYIIYILINKKINSRSCNKL